MRDQKLYNILGVQPNADDKQIKSAYRKLAKKYHPDSNQGNASAEEKFKEVNEAYDILSDPEKRKLYDRFGMAAFDGSIGPNPGEQEFYGNGGNYSGGFRQSNGNGGYTEYHFTSDGGDMDDILHEFFGNMFRGGESGGKSYRTYGSGQGFDGCGQGFNRNAYSGSGQGFYGGFGQGFNGNAYNGSGFKSRGGQGFGGSSDQGANLRASLTVSFEEAALGCDKVLQFGDGSSEKLQVHIPAGIDEGQKVRLKGKGQPGSNGAVAGDLFVTIHIAPSDVFERKGSDVYTKAWIPFTTAALGGNVNFRTIDGKVQCHVPAGTTSGQKIRLKEKGIVSMKNPKVRGDEYVIIQIDVPKNLSPSEREAIEQLQRAQNNKTAGKTQKAG